MKSLITLFALVSIAAGQATGDYLLQRKTATGYEPKTITPESGKVLSWDGSGNPTNITPITSLSWDAISGKPSTFAPIVGSGATDAAAGNHGHATLANADGSNITTPGDWKTKLAFLQEADVSAAYQPLIADGSLSLAKLAQASATSGQVIKWNGTAWAPAEDTGGTVDNEAITTALGYTPADAAENPLNGSVQINTPYTIAKMNGWGTSSPYAPLKVAVIGDSLALFGGGLGLPTVPTRGFIGMYPNLGTGTLTPLSDFTLWVTGRAYRIGVGNTRTFMTNGVSVYHQGDKAMIAFVAQPGAGTFTLKATNDAAVTTTLATIDATKDGLGNTVSVPTGVVLTYNLTTTSGPSYLLTIDTVTGNSVDVLFGGIYTESGAGVVAIQQSLFAEGGLDVHRMLETPSAIFNPVWQFIAPDLVLSRFADSYRVWGPANPTPNYSQSSAPPSPTDDQIWLDTDDGISYFYKAGTASWEKCGNWRTLYANMKALYANTDFVQICRNPTDNESTADNLQRASQKAWAKEFNEGFIDALSLMGETWARANARGLMADFVHQSAAGASVINDFVWQKTRLSNYFMGGKKMGAFNLVRQVGYNGTEPKFSIDRQVQLTQGLWFRDTTATSDRTDSQAYIRFDSKLLDFNLGAASNYLRLSYANNGTAGLYPGFNTMFLGSDSLRWRPFFLNTNISGAVILVPDALTATTSPTAAVPITTPTTALTTTAAAQPLSLANGTVGQIKTIMHVATSGGGTAVLTPTTKTGYTTITFTNVGDTVTLQYFTTYGWMIVSIRGAVAA